MQIPFSSSERASLGVEWELQLVDRETRELTAGAVEILEEMRPDGAEEHPKAKHELLQSTIEIITGICTTVAEAKADLAGTLAEVRRGRRAPRAGPDVRRHPPVHRLADPADLARRSATSSSSSEMQWLARRLQIFGVHVHVGVRSPEKAIPIVNALCQYVPHFLALSASSPFWMGADTGLASARTKVFEGMPTAGLPYQLSGWDEFENYMETLISTHAIESVREVWWDIRPHPTSAPSSCGSATGCRRSTRSARSPRCRSAWSSSSTPSSTAATPCRRRRGWVLQENKWRAARYGLDADIVVDEKGTVRPVRQALARPGRGPHPDGAAAGLRGRAARRRADPRRRRLLPAAAGGRGGVTAAT